MTFHNVRKWLRAASVTAMLCGGLAAQSVLLAQAVVYPIPQPYTDTGIALAPAHMPPIREASSNAAWGGVRSGSETTLSDRVASYTIAATLDPVRHTVAGNETLTWRNRSRRVVRSVYVHLYLNAFEHKDTTFYTEQRRGQSMFGSEPIDDGWGYTKLNQVRQGQADVPWSFVQPDNGPAGDHTVARLDLPQPVEPGGTAQLDIAFTSQLPKLGTRSGYVGSFHFVAQWFPKIGVLELPGERGAVEERWNVHEYHADSEFYADFGLYDVKLTVPREYTVGATGKLQGAPEERNGMLTHHYVQGDVHDFAWTADKRYAAPLTGTWQGKNGQPVDIRVLYTPEFAASAAPSLQAAKDALSWYASLLGPYPYATLTIVIPPYNATGAAGMEYPTLYTADSFTHIAPGSRQAFDMETVNIHEFAHNYFQGIIASNEFEEPLLDEGMNEYTNMRMQTERGHKSAIAPPWLRRLGINPAVEPFDTERADAILNQPADAGAASAYVRLQGVGQVYVRGALLFRDLEAQLGKEALTQGLREYYRRWRFRHPSVADLREALADGSGQRALVERLFDLQVFGAGRIDDSVAEFQSEQEPAASGSKSGPQWRTEVLLRRRGAAVPQTLAVHFADGSTETVQWDPKHGEQWQRFVWTRTARGLSAELDPQRKHMLDVNKLDDSRTATPDKSAARRWTLDLAAAVQLVLTLIASL
ncbi:M1 family metallopeptidase [Pseudoduganella ginsengisoli]|uniref:M1 family peptidase n=1 Tax=Pseudoduganella ginsengisoli TaxID=1462440 RepID=A0A6L6Q4N6_9BURK|nr:M1 family metallopeptidase [Pseudoduganella ginsengisoli]MTW04082.1 M1 family peptidase [Pseudoduganella ginsengisoli]